MTRKTLLPWFLRLRFFAAFAVVAVAAMFANAQDDSTAGIEAAPAPTKFRIGEKLSYNLSFGRFLNAGHAEFAVQSRGRLRGIDVIELRSRIKTFELVSAAFFMVDETRTAYVQPESGVPIYIVKVTNTGPLPKETAYDFFKIPTTSFDLLTFFYRLRESGGVGSFNLTENERLHTVTLTPSGSERVRTDVGELETNVSDVQSDLFGGLAVKDVQIGLTADDHKYPVFLRFKTPKGVFRATLASITLPEPVVIRPTPAPTPVPTPVAKPSPTPDVYVDNMSLLPELGFQIGEVLQYRVAANGLPAGIVTLNARERKRINNLDTLVLNAVVTAGAAGADALRPGDTIENFVHPDTLAPRYSVSRFASVFPSLNQTLTFDTQGGGVSTGGKTIVDAPIGTHTVLSMLYAMRSFNLKPSKNPSNPVNDTRVAVFWGDKPMIWTLRPSNPEEIVINGEKFAAQLITFTTGDDMLDKLGLKVWLGAEDRVPLRFAAGGYTADLVSRLSNLPK
jgi:hypothetical protein